MRRIAILCASALLLMGSTAACGDDDSDDKGSAGDPASQTESESPTDSESTETESSDPTESESSDPTESTETESSDPDRSEFCTAAVAEGFDEGGFTEIKTWAEGLSQETPPAEFTADQSAGLTVMLGLVQGADDEAALKTATNKLTPEETKQVTAFLTYVNTECSP